ncbi:unnamed protein product, partial [Meganyctiphanes norvegica]
SKRREIVGKDVNKSDDDGEPKPRKGLTTEPPDEECAKLRDMCFMATAYAANLGGTGAITGTGPNLVLKGILEDEYCEPTGLNFASWMGFNVPGMLICILLAWGWLQVIFMGCKRNSLGESSPEKEHAVKKLLRQKYNDLGRMTYHEATVLTLFIILVLLWLFRSPEFVPGWAQWFMDAYGIKVGDATPAMLIVFLLFIIPAELNFWCFRDKNDPSPPRSSPACLTWKVVQEKVPWGIVLLLGGGFAMAEATKKSHLDDWIGSQLTYFDVMPKELIVFVVCLMTAMLTEVASNTATASILMPVLNKMAIGINVNPLYLMLPAAVTCSYAFMLPVATPPNAIVFGAANMKSKDMMRAGVVMNVICVCVVTLMINTLGVVMFDLNTMPSWINSTAPCDTFNIDDTF